MLLAYLKSLSMAGNPPRFGCNLKLGISFSFRRTVRFKLGKARSLLMRGTGNGLYATFRSSSILLRPFGGGGGAVKLLYEWWFAAEGDCAATTGVIGLFCG